MHWESLFPVPPPEAATYHTDPRIAMADQRITQWDRVAPELASMHEFRAHLPIESIVIEALSFQGIAWYYVYGFIPSYIEYISRQTMIPALSYGKRVMKLLQWKNPRQRWILKSPDALRYLPDVFEVFPDLQLIWMHRDPIKSLSSLVNLIGTLFWIRSDKLLDGSFLASLVNPEGMSTSFNNAIDWIEQGKIPAAQICSIQYNDLITEPLACIEKLYRQGDIELTDNARQSIAKYLRENPREKRPLHQYSIGDKNRFSDERKYFARYQKFFNVASEV